MESTGVGLAAQIAIEKMGKRRGRGRRGGRGPPPPQGRAAKTPPSPHYPHRASAGPTGVAVVRLVGRPDGAQVCLGEVTLAPTWTRALTTREWPVWRRQAVSSPPVCTVGHELTEDTFWIRRRGLKRPKSRSKKRQKTANRQFATRAAFFATCKPAQGVLWLHIRAWVGTARTIGARHGRGGAFCVCCGDGHCRRAGAR